MNEEQIQNHINQLNVAINQLDVDNANLVSMLHNAKQTIAYYRSQIEQLSKRNAELEQSVHPATVEVEHESAPE